MPMNDGLEDAGALRSALSNFDPAATRRGATGDPFFVRRVMNDLPPRRRGARLSPERRASVLAAFYVGAVALALGGALVVPDAVGVWFERTHALAHDVLDVAPPVESTGLAPLGGELGLGLGVGLVALAVAVVLALVPSRVNTPAT